ncbi:MAG: hypothetical protein RLY86_894 [Pseudomonadota bacterium]|jgi:cytoskeletal protein CcmA (bactofilin family)
MFAKVKERLDTSVKSSGAAAGGPTSSSGRAMPSIIGPDMLVTGNLSTPGEVRVEGRVDGDVTCAKLIIGDGGTVQGHVTAGSVKVHGKVIGAIEAEEVFLLAGSEVLGDIIQGSLEIAPGALFEGAVRRRPPAAAAAQAPRPVAALEPPPPVATVTAPAPAAAPLEREGQFEVVADAPKPATDTPAAKADTAKTDSPAAEPAKDTAPKDTAPKGTVAKAAAE